MIVGERIGKAVAEVQARRVPAFAEPAKRLARERGLFGVEGHYLDLRAPKQLIKLACVLAALGAERRIAASFNPQSKRYDAQFPIWTWLFSWLLAVAIVFVPISVFTQEVPQWAISSRL